uniref:Uncharacterized protein n=1 Tax=Lepeophtheirus salmonis TaxID=72036 RepID=A0A0K2SXC9_LEPSM
MPKEDDVDDALISRGNLSFNFKALSEACVLLSLRGELVSPLQLLSVSLFSLGPGSKCPVLGLIRICLLLLLPALEEGGGGMIKLATVVEGGRSDAGCMKSWT